MPCSGNAVCLQNFLGSSDIKSLALSVLDGVITILIPLLVLAIVWAGASLVFSSGKPEAIAKNRKNLIWAIIGALIVLAAKGILTVVEKTIEDIKKNPISLQSDELHHHQVTKIS